MSTSRWAAVTSAVLITALTVTGALGLGPGAAMGETTGPRSLAAIGQVHSQGSEPSGGSQGADPDESSTDGARSNTQIDDWLTIDKPPVRDRPPPRRSSEPASTELPSKSGAGKRIVFDESAQRVWLVSADNQVVRTYLVSGAKDEDLLEPGDYHVYSKSRDAVSYNLKETMNYMVRFAAGDNAAIGFHDLPAHRDGTLAQSRDELGTPLSAGCIRQWITDARALWEFARVDTLVVVIP